MRPIPIAMQLRRCAAYDAGAFEMRFVALFERASLFASSLEAMAETLMELAAEPTMLSCSHSPVLLDLPWEMHDKLHRLCQAREIAGDVLMRLTAKR
jgi:hypothetical protein